MHPAQIKAALEMRGFKQSDIAESCGYEHATVVWQVIHGRARSEKVESKIAEITGFSCEVLWPAWDGKKKRAKPSLSKEEVVQAFRSAAA